MLLEKLRNQQKRKLKNNFKKSKQQETEIKISKEYPKYNYV